jgi:peptidoglycan/LPS O-acetylase OafA/YrhL
VLLPTLPNGGWSITAEAHFYVLLPLLLWMLRRSKMLMVGALLIAIVVRAVILVKAGQVQTYAYPTIIGRFDQFALGILFFHLRTSVQGRHALAACAGGAFLSFYWLFDRAGGYYQLGGFPSASPLWVVMPTIEGVAYALLIAWYDSSFRHSTSRISRLVARFGELSYSIYLLHFFFVAAAADFVHRHIMDISNFYAAAAWAAVFFVLMYVPAALSFRFIEMPALRLRRPYLLQRNGRLEPRSTTSPASASR